MISRETRVVLTSGVVGTALAVGVDFLGGVDDWVGLLTFVYVGLFWYAIPQLYLSARGDQGIAVLRVRLIPVVLFLLALAVSLSGVAGRGELLGIWGIVGVAVALLFGAAFRRGYRDAMRDSG